MIHIPLRLGNSQVAEPFFFFKFNPPLIFVYLYANIMCMSVLKEIKIKKLLVFVAVAILLFNCTGCSQIKNNVINKIFDSPQRETVRLTFPEGSTVAEIAKILEDGGVCTAEEFLVMADDADLLTEFGFKVENPQNRAFALEGYLFPDTYDFYVDEGPSSAINRFLSNSQKKYADILAKCNETGYSFDEILTIASVIQEEVGYPAEMGKVSSVLHNRLASEQYPKLQCDATINYLENSVKDYVTEEEYAALVEAYNTYKCDDLPEGPITNPGLDAVNAALNPANTSYYFFISDSDNVYHYAETYSEHLELCAEAGLI